MGDFYNVPIKHIEIMKKYLINNIGIGDLIFFCFKILISDKNINEPIYISISDRILKGFRNNSENYKNFCLDFIRFFLNEYTIKSSSDDLIDYNVYEVNLNRVGEWFTGFDREYDYIKTRLFTNQKKIFEDNYVVIFTKVRHLYSQTFSTVLDSFFDSLNNSDFRIVLIGERDVDYVGENLIHGKDEIYSIYNQAILKLDKNKIIDLTFDSYNFDQTNLEDILSDFAIIRNSKKTFVFGGGGFFCLSLFSGKLISLTNPNYEQIFKSSKNPYIFSNVNQFKNILKIFND